MEMRLLQFSGLEELVRNENHENRTREPKTTQSRSKSHSLAHEQFVSHIFSLRDCCRPLWHLVVVWMASLKIEEVIPG